MIEQSELDEFDLSVSPAKKTRWDSVALTSGPGTNGSALSRSTSNGAARTGSLSNENSEDVEPVGKKERGGVFLVAIVALLLPVIFVAAFALSDTDSSSDVEQGIATPTSTGLDSVGISEDDPAEVDEGLAQTTPRGASSLVGQSNSNNTINALEGLTSGSVALSTDPVEAVVAGTIAVADSGVDDAPIESTDVIGDDSPQASAKASTLASTAAAPSTTTPPTTATPSDNASAPTTPATTASPATTSAPTTTVTPTTAAVSPSPTLSERIDIDQLGDTFVRVRFAAGSTTSYRVVVLGEGRVVATRTGTAIGGQTVNVSVDGLTPGMDYNIQVSLNGPPAFTSAPVSFRTSGGAPEPIVQQVELLNLRIVETGSTRFELNYESNICANGSFTIRERGTGTVVGSNAGQTSGCTTRHLAIPGFWTAALKPNTTYIITVAVEAGGAGLGNGNTAVQSISVTTN